MVKVNHSLSKEECDVWHMMGMSVCLSLTELENHMAELSQFFVLVACGPVLVLLWLCCNTLSISGFVDDIMFLYNGFSDSSDEHPAYTDVNGTCHFTFTLLGGLA